MMNTEVTEWNLELIKAVAEDVAREQREGEQRMHEVVEQARFEKATWQQIADQLGTTKQAAQQRFGSQSPLVRMTD